MNDIYHQWIPDILRLARSVAPGVLALRKPGLNIQTKSDGSPVTQADLYAHNMITRGLAALSSDIPIISEEDPSSGTQVPANYTRYWLIDPIDGTKEFIKGSDEFTTNIALIEAGKPVLGLISVPARDHYYWATPKAAYFQAGFQPPRQIHARKALQFPLKVAVSRSHSHKRFEKFATILEKLGDYELIPCGSSLKMCLVAAGEIDLYPCFGRTFLWDTAAGQCIVEAAGGSFADFFGKPLSYAPSTLLNNPPFLVTSCVALLSGVVDNYVDGIQKNN